MGLEKALPAPYGPFVGFRTLAPPFFATPSRAPEGRAGPLEWPPVASAGPRTPLPDLYEVPAPPEGNILADTVVLAHGPRPLTSKRSFTQ